MSFFTKLIYSPQITKSHAAYSFLMNIFQSRIVISPQCIFLPGFAFHNKKSYLCKTSTYVIKQTSDTLRP